MKARSKELLDRAIAAMVSAIEVYNKPDFLYREESFALLAINGWELMLKAKWLSDHKNSIRSLYVYERMVLKSGKCGRKLCIKTTRSGNAFTHGMDYLAHKLVEAKALDPRAWSNLQALLEIRDSAVHFYNHTGSFALRLQEIGTATLRNFVATCRAWFGRDLSEFNFYLMPLSFVAMPHSAEAVVLNPEERNFVAYVKELEGSDGGPDSDYSVSINIEVRFIRSTASDALGVRITNEPSASAVRLTEEQIRKKYPWDYRRLSSECKKRYAGFKEDGRYHTLRKSLLSDTKFGLVRYLDPSNLKSSRKPFFNPNILQEFDKHYAPK